MLWLCPGGGYSDFKVSSGGSAVWLHVVSGSIEVLLLPPTPANQYVYEAWIKDNKPVRLLETHPL